MSAQAIRRATRSRHNRGNASSLLPCVTIRLAPRQRFQAPFIRARYSMKSQRQTLSVGLPQKRPISATRWPSSLLRCSAEHQRHVWLSIQRLCSHDGHGSLQSVGWTQYEARGSIRAVLTGGVRAVIAVSPHHTSPLLAVAKAFAPRTP